MNTELTNWATLIAQEMACHGETFADVVSSTLSDDQLRQMFDRDFGGKKAPSFTVWTADRVYFPTEYDTAQDVASVARNPDGKPTEH
jgi:hypothetical protein